MPLSYIISRLFGLSISRGTLIPHREEYGLSQSDIAREVGIKPSNISRIESGEQRPRDLPTVLVLASAYRLKPHETAEWCGLLWGVNSSNDYPLQSDLEFAKGRLKNICWMRTTGFPVEANEEAEGINDWLLSKVGVDDPAFNLFQAIRVEVLYEQSLAFRDFGTFESIESLTSSALNEIERIARVCQSKEFGGLANLLKGDTLYITKKSSEAIVPLKAALEALRNPIFQLDAVRLISITTAHLGDLNCVEEMEKKAIKLIIHNEIPLERVCITYEGLARAFAHVRQTKKAFNYIQMGKEIYAQMVRDRKDMPMRNSQLVRSHLTVLTQLDPANKQELQRIELIDLPAVEKEAYRYPRQADEARQMLNQCLN